ncbi:MAG TPA: gliding motility-associated C-terminal domain-containing protein [Cytophagaceae bacterium]|jgi:hypothetical protein
MRSPFILIILLCLFGAFPLYATHIKAGEITVKKRATDYEFTLTVYFDQIKIQDPSFSEKERNPEVKIFVDGERTPFINRKDIFINDSDISDIGNNTTRYIYRFYESLPNDQYYTVSYSNVNRIENIQNIGGSVNVAFNVQTTFYATNNNTPQLTIPPIDQASANKLFTHNPGAYDSEGDSISFEFITARKQYLDPITDYVLPADPRFRGQSVTGGPSTITLNPLNGDLVWNAPSKGDVPRGTSAFYTVAFVVKEYRKISSGRIITLSETVRDMLIEVRDLENNPPKITLPNDTCIAANTKFEKSIGVDDPDKDNVFLRAFSQMIPPANFKLNNPLGTDKVRVKGSGILTWQTGCEDVREQPYLFTFKAEDDVALNLRLADLKTFSIKVLGPKPTGLKVIPSNGSFKLSWDKYCNSIASSRIRRNILMSIFRKECDTLKPAFSACSSGSEGYGELIGSVPIDSLGFTDTLNLNIGKKYCYVISASFPGTAQGKSYISDQQCSVLPIDNALLTQVSVEKTDLINGKIRISWLKPLDLDLAAFPGPYKYIVFRGDSLRGPAASTPIDTLYNLNDTVSFDSFINTRDLAYRYQVVLQYGDQNTNKESNVEASTIFLTGNPGNKSISLSWNYNVPWDNSDSLQFVYRKKESELEFKVIDSIQGGVSASTYTDTDSLLNDTTYCYYVVAKGGYCRPDIKPLIINQSQIVCVTPRDTLLPCPPTLSLDSLNCDLIKKDCNQTLSNTLSWKADTLGEECNRLILGYNLYFSPRKDVPFTILKTFNSVFDSGFKHMNLSSQAGCYYITAFNKYNMESAPSNTECIDNCAYFELPNLITPNNDGQNDIFQAYKCVTGVEKVEFSVYNSWGGLVYFTDTDVNINWNPKNVNDGIYYYSAKVIFARRLEKNEEQKLLKGWVHVLGNHPTQTKPIN